MALTRNAPQARRPVFELDERVGFVKLYLDDLNEFVRVLRARSGQVVLGAGTATADEPDDLKSATTNELAAITIRTIDPMVVIWLQPHRCLVRTAEDSESAKALVVDSAHLLKQHRGGFARAAGMHALGSAIVPALILLLSLLAALLGGTPETALTFAFGALGVWIVIFVVSWRETARGGGATLVLQTRANAREANAGSKVLVVATVLATAVGAVMGAVVVFLMGLQQA